MKRYFKKHTQGPKGTDDKGGYSVDLKLWKVKETEMVNLQRVYQIQGL